MAAAAVGTPRIPVVSNFAAKAVSGADEIRDTLGAGPGSGRLVVDLDSTICEVFGDHKQGAAYGYTKVLGYHPLLATRADTGEVLFARMRKGSAGSSRGVVRFVDELVANLTRAGATGVPARARHP